MQDFDKILQQIGEFGRYQQTVMWLLCIPACFMNAYNAFALVFLAYTPDHKCKVPADSHAQVPLNYTNVSATACEVIYPATNSGNFRVEKCNSWDYDTSYFESTVITRWDLVCDDAIQAKNIISITRVFTIIGCFLFSYVQDRFGRRPAMTINVIFYVTSSILSVFMPNLMLFTIMRCLAAMTALSCWNIGYIWAIEYVGLSKRTLVTAIMCVLYGVGNVSTALIAYLSSDYVQMGLAISVPFALLISLHFIILESPRWLLTKGRTEEAVVVVKRMIHWSGGSKAGITFDSKQLHELLNQEPQLPESVPLTNMERNHNVNEEEMRSPDHNEPLDLTTDIVPDNPNSIDQLSVVPSQVAEPAKASTSPLDLVRGPVLRMKTLLITICWIANVIVYDGIAFNVENLGSNLYLTWVLQSAVECPATFLNLFLLDRFGRIWPLCTSMVLGGLFCLLTSPGQEILPIYVIVLFTVFGKFCITMSYAMIYQLAAELYPTVVRGLGIGTSSLVAFACSVAMPYIIHSTHTYKMLPMIIIGCLAIFTGLPILLLPETLNRPMPETLAEAELQGKVGWKTVKGHFRRLKYCCSSNSADAGT